MYLALYFGCISLLGVSLGSGNFISAGICLILAIYFLMKEDLF